MHHMGRECLTLLLWGDPINSVCVCVCVCLSVCLSVCVCDSLRCLVEGVGKVLVYLVEGVAVIFLATSCT